MHTSRNASEISWTGTARREDLSHARRDTPLTMMEFQVPFLSLCPSPLPFGANLKDSGIGVWFSFSNSIRLKLGPFFV